METFQHNLNRLLAAAVAAGCVVASAPSLAFTVQITGAPTGTTCQSASIDAQNNVTINCSTGSTPSNPPPSNPPPPPPTTGSISCSNIGGISKTITIPVSWATTIGTGFSTSKAGGMTPGTAAVFVVDVPVGASSNGSKGSFRISPTDATAYNMRILSVSTSPCDFSRSLGTASVVQGQDVRVYFTVGGHATDRYGRQITSVADLSPGKRYYFTVIGQKSVGGENSCTSSVCNINYGLTPGTGN